MAKTHTVTLQVNIGTKVIISNRTFTADGNSGRDITLPDSTTDQEVEMVFTLTGLKSIYIHSDKDITLETNTTAGVDTIAIKANQAFVWNTEIENYFANPFSADVTKFFLTNASGGDATIQIEVLHDSTP